MLILSPFFATLESLQFSIPHISGSSIYFENLFYCILSSAGVRDTQSCMHCCSAPLWDNTVFTVIMKTNANV